MKTIKRGLPALVAVLALSLLAASPANAARAGSTTLNPNHKLFEGIVDSGYGVKTTGKAKDGKNGIRFPMVSGKADPETGAAKFTHTGGIKLSGPSGSSLTFKNLIIKVRAKNSVVKATANGKKLKFAELNTKKLDINQGKTKFVYSNMKAKVAKPAAKALSMTIGMPDISGATLGKLTSKYVLPK